MAQSLDEIIAALNAQVVGSSSSVAAGLASLDSVDSRRNSRTLADTANAVALLKAVKPKVQSPAPNDQMSQLVQLLTLVTLLKKK